VRSLPAVRTAPSARGRPALPGATWRASY
jgi:hypothetical protein